jgi:uncharacterized membrane protein HdeD (DUF308 family)
MIPSLIVASIAIGLLPPAGAWWAQGLMISVPVATIAFGHRMTAIRFLKTADAIKSRHRSPLIGSLRLTTIFGLAAFVFGASASFVPGIDEHAGLLCLGVTIAMAGCLYLEQGLRSTPRAGKLRMGLSILGGFVAAALILLSDWTVKAFS